MGRNKQYWDRLRTTSWRDTNSVNSLISQSPRYSFSAFCSFAFKFTDWFMRRINADFCLSIIMAQSRLGTAAEWQNSGQDFFSKGEILLRLESVNVNCWITCCSVMSINSDDQPLIKLQRHWDAEKCHHQQIVSFSCYSEFVLHNEIDGSCQSNVHLGGTVLIQSVPLPPSMITGTCPFIQVCVASSMGLSESESQVPCSTVNQVVFIGPSSTAPSPVHSLPISRGLTVSQLRITAQRSIVSWETASHQFVLDVDRSTDSRIWLAMMWIQ